MNMLYHSILISPASAGCNGPDPVRFFTGRAGTLQENGGLVDDLMFFCAP